jgi:hypothetical protein
MLLSKFSFGLGILKTGSVLITVCRGFFGGGCTSFFFLVCWVPVIPRKNFVCLK